MVTGALVRGEVARDDAGQGRLARAVGADEGDALPLADAELDAVEQGASVGEREPDLVDLEMCHESRVSLPVCRPTNSLFARE